MHPSSTRLSEGECYADKGLVGRGGRSWSRKEEEEKKTYNIQVSGDITPGQKNDREKEPKRALGTTMVCTYLLSPFWYTVSLMRFSQKNPLYSLNGYNHQKPKWRV